MSHAPGAVPGETSGVVPGEAPGAALTVPQIDPESTGFWEGTAAGELRMQACRACGQLRFPPQVMCPACHHTGRAWRRVSGRGTIWSFVVAHPPLLPAYSALAPYNVIVVSLEEGPALRMVGNLVTGPDGALNEIDPASIVIGEAVSVVFTHRRGTGGEEVWMPGWVRSVPPGGEAVGAVRDATGGAVRDATGGAVRDATGGAVRDATGGAV